MTILKTMTQRKREEEPRKSSLDASYDGGLLSARSEMREKAQGSASCDRTSLEIPSDKTTFPVTHQALKSEQGAVSCWSSPLRHTMKPPRSNAQRANEHYAWFDLTNKTVVSVMRIPSPSIHHHYSCFLFKEPFSFIGEAFVVRRYCSLSLGVVVASVCLCSLDFGICFRE